MEDLIEIFSKIEELALEVHATEADYEYCMTQIENLAKKGQKLVEDEVA